MMRRDFLKTGVGGMGLALAGGVARADGIPAAGRSAPGAQAADANIVVIGRIETGRDPTQRLTPMSIRLRAYRGRLVEKKLVVGRARRHDRGRKDRQSLLPQRTPEWVTVFEVTGMLQVEQLMVHERL